MGVKKKRGAEKNEVKKIGKEKSGDKKKWR